MERPTPPSPNIANFTIPRVQFGTIPRLDHWRQLPHKDFHSRSKLTQMEHKYVAVCNKYNVDADWCNIYCVGAHTVQLVQRH